MKRKRNSSSCRNSYTRKKMKTTLTKKDDYLITIETQVEHTMYCEQTNKRPASKSDISSKVVKWLVGIARFLLTNCF